VSRHNYSQKQLKIVNLRSEAQRVSGVTIMDILEAVAIELRCVSCGAHYEITLRQVLISEQMLHEGCPVPIQFTNECPPLYYAEPPPKYVPHVKFVLQT